MFFKQLIHLRLSQLSLNVTQIRYARNIKPWNVGPEGLWRKLRAKKVLKVDLPDFQEMRLDDKLTPEQIRSRLKEKGVVPPHVYNERPIFMSCTNGILDPYVPPEGDGKMSLISQSGAKQVLEKVTKKGKSMLALRKIRTYEDELDIPTFAEQALHIYIKAHNALAQKDYDSLHEYVTEHAFPQITFKTDLKTIKWQFISSLEKPIVSHIRTLDVITKNNLFAQITVRLHTRQILAIYDRFGHLMLGSDAIVKDVLEYVVLEKHVANLYGKWRIHGKIVPHWMPTKPAIINTFVSPPKPPPMTEREIRFEREGLMSDQRKEEENKKEEHQSKQSGQQSPQTAIA